MAYGTSGAIGVNLAANETTASQALGTREPSTDNQEYVYVLAGSAITQYQFVGIDEDFNAYPLTKAMADDGWIIGVAQTALTAASYGWIAIRGANLTGNVSGSCAADVTVYTTGTAGQIDDTSTSQTNLDGVVVVATNGTTAAANVEVLLTYARSTTF